LERWFIKNKGIDYREIARKLNISSIISKILVNRGIYTEDSIDIFLNSSIEKMHPPSQMKDLVKAGDLLKNKIDNGKSIRIVGDYDVDGIMSVYLLYRAFKDLGAKVDYIIPNRVSEGYGLNVEIVKEAEKDNIDTIITCDNGIAAIEAIDHAKKVGIDVIVTDHHNLSFVEEDGEKRCIVPAAVSIVNPKQPDCPYPFKGLCGAGVVYKLVEYLFEIYNLPKEKSYKLLEYVAIATICDVVDLVDENRIIVKHGLKQINATKNLGFKTLVDVLGIKNEIGTYHIGFIIGPTLNASGRLDTAYLALELLLTEDKNKAIGLAKELKALNEDRKAITEKGIKLVVEKIENTGIKNDKVLIIYEPKIHESVAGIVAGRVKEIYNKPTIVLTEGLDSIKGSGRSIEEYDMFKELVRCKDILDKFGGHPMAAGLSLKADNIELLRTRLNKNTDLTENDLIKKIYIDMPLPIEYINYKLINQINGLEPFGKGNPRPLFGDRGLKIKQAFKLGANKRTIKLILQSKKGISIEGLLFNGADKFEETIITKYGRKELENMYEGYSNNIILDILYYPSINEYMNRRSIQVIIQNYRV